jgi:hypothetical protein
MRIIGSREFNGRLPRLPRRVPRDVTRPSRTIESTDHLSTRGVDHTQSDHDEIGGGNLRPRVTAWIASTHEITLDTGAPLPCRKYCKKQFVTQGAHSLMVSLFHSRHERIAARQRRG